MWFKGYLKIFSLEARGVKEKQRVFWHFGNFPKNWTVMDYVELERKKELLSVETCIYQGHCP